MFAELSRAMTSEMPIPYLSEDTYIHTNIYHPHGRDKLRASRANQRQKGEVVGL